MEECGIILVALKWAVLVFLAGFVGYFGKYLGIRIIARFQKHEDAQQGEGSGKVRATDQTGESGTPAPDVPLAEDARGLDDKLLKKQEKERLKQSKKLDKTKIKEQKKGSG